MHIERIYIQDNFVPDYVSDPFRRKVFGMGIFIKEGENVGDAIAEAEKQISDYIKINTVDNSMSGTIVRNIVEDAKEREDKIKEEYLEVEAKLNEFKFQEDAVAYLDTTTFKHYIPAKQIANSKPIKNK